MVGTSIHFFSTNTFRLRPGTLKDFEKRFHDAVNESQYSKGSDVLIKRDFHLLNVLDDDIQQPYSEEFVDRLFDYFAIKNNLEKGVEFRMNCRTFVDVRRMLFYIKVSFYISISILFYNTFSPWLVASSCSR